jgi:hypothetical protein
VAGSLELQRQAFVVAERTDLLLVTHTAAPGSPSARAVRVLLDENANGPDLAHQDW